MKDRREHHPLELDVFVPVQMPEEFVLWAMGYLSASSTKSISATGIYAMFQPVGVVMMAGATFPGTREQAYEFAYASYCNTMEAICRQRGYDKHPHRHLRPANDD